MQFDALISVSPDGKKIIITNKKPVENPNYILNADPAMVKDRRDREKFLEKYRHQQMRKQLKRLSTGEFDKEDERINAEKAFSKLKQYDMSVPETHDHQESSDSLIIDSDDDIVRNIDLEEECNHIKEHISFEQSSSSKNISEIKGIVYGGINSRFWIYRKHMCSLEYNKVKNDSQFVRKGRRMPLPFYAW